MRPVIALLSSALLLAEATLSPAPLPSYTAAERRHWSFQPIASPAVPQFTAAADQAWIRTPIDAFVLEKLIKEGLRPAPPADRATLLRRATLDLWGLPPAPADLDAFAKERSPQAWEKQVDRLLASPHYGERWAQHWLDVIRFAESDGYEYDTHRREAWRFRDYVIHAFNSDKPYDEFVREQLAGDEINPHNETLRIASGFQRLAPLRKNAGNQEVASSRNEELTEMTNVVGAALLGVTLGCARCHDHKFDPIRHSDYYRMQAFFSAAQAQEVPLTSAEEQAAWKQKSESVETELKQIKAALKNMKGDELSRMTVKLSQTEAQVPEPLPTLYSVQNDMARTKPIHILPRGDHERPGASVGMRPLGILVDAQMPDLPVTTAKPRTRLAEWIFAKDNPLTARVMANRLWQSHFGRGLVATANDFGRMGSRPSHRELLDYLALDLRDHGWNLKRMHRRILLSSTYQQATKSPLAAAAGQKDPERTWLWAFPRHRMDAEQLRDTMLAASGALNVKAGGPSVITPVDPDLPKLLYKPSQWAIHPDASEHARRSIYLFQKRNLRLPFMEVFDAPDRSLSCARRDSSTHAPQALEMLNGDIANFSAGQFALRLQKEAGTAPARQVDLAYRLAMGRAPSVAERQAALEFLKTQPLREFALAVFNLNAFLYVN